MYVYYNEHFMISAIQAKQAFGESLWLYSITYELSEKY